MQRTKEFVNEYELDRLARRFQRLASVHHARRDVIGGHTPDEDLALAGARHRANAVLCIGPGTDDRAVADAACRLVVEPARRGASGQSAGLASALRLAGFEATVLELSWYGTRSVALPLGEAFHALRLTLKSSQVGQVAPAQRARWTRQRRLMLALSLLSDPVLDALITDRAPFEQLPQVLARLAAADSSSAGTLCQRIDYPGSD